MNGKLFFKIVNKCLNCPDFYNRGYDGYCINLRTIRFLVQNNIISYIGEFNKITNWCQLDNEKETNNENASRNIKESSK